MQTKKDRKASKKKKRINDKHTKRNTENMCMRTNKEKRKNKKTEQFYFYCSPRQPHLGFVRTSYQREVAL